MSNRGRIVIRNLSYKATDESVKEFFKAYGEIKEVCILKYENGKMKGVAFLEYNNMPSALKAVKECNMKLFMKRPLAVDIAIPKEKYKAHQDSQDADSKEFLPQVIKEESEDDSPEPPDEKPPNKMEWEGNREDEDNDDTDSDTDGDDEDDDGDEEEDEEDRKPSFVHKPVSNDVTEGKTLFLSNLSFDAAEEHIEEALSQFGDLKYVLFCRDKITKRSRGTAFAQFRSREAADECLDAFDDPAYKTQFTFGGRTLFGQRALGRGDVVKVKETKLKKKDKVDKRNVYLAREGVIREGTKSALNVSKTDLRLRLEREKQKRKMVANLNIIVSPLRLFVCNLPIELADKGLRNIFKKHSSPKAVITESRIMRNLYQLDQSGIAVSKGHGFVTFTQHRHALEALRNVNNNPTIFSAVKRPLVEFSMENKGALKAKANRLQKSREKNPTSKSFQFVPKEKVVAGKAESEEFSGAQYDPSKKGMKALHSHMGPKIRHRDSKKNQPGGAKITRNKINNQFRSSKIVRRNKPAGSKTKPGRLAKAKKDKKENKNKKDNKNSKKRPATDGNKQKNKKRKFI